MADGQAEGEQAVERRACAVRIDKRISTADGAVSVLRTDTPCGALIVWRCTDAGCSKRNGPNCPMGWVCTADPPHAQEAP